MIRKTFTPKNRSVSAQNSCSTPKNRSLTPRVRNLPSIRQLHTPSGIPKQRSLNMNGRCQPSNILFKNRQRHRRQNSANLFTPPAKPSARLEYLTPQAGDTANSSLELFVKHERMISQLSTIEESKSTKDSPLDKLLAKQTVKGLEVLIAEDLIAFREFFPRQNIPTGT